MNINTLSILYKEENKGNYEDRLLEIQVYKYDIDHNYFDRKVIGVEFEMTNNDIDVYQDLLNLGEMLSSSPLQHNFGKFTAYLKSHNVLFYIRGCFLTEISISENNIIEFYISSDSISIFPENEGIPPEILRIRRNKNINDVIE